MPGVLEGGHDQVAGLGVEVGRDLSVEVVGHAVTDVGLDQALEPVGRRGVLVEEIERTTERRHRLERVRPEVDEPVQQRGDVRELGALLGSAALAWSAKPVLMIAARPGSSSTRSTRIGGNLHCRTHTAYFCNRDDSYDPLGCNQQDS